MNGSHHRQLKSHVVIQLATHLLSILFYKINHIEISITYRMLVEPPPLVFKVFGATIGRNNYNWPRIKPWLRRDIILI